MQGFESIISGLTAGAETFTPAAMTGIIVFCVMFDGFCSLIGSILGGMRR